MNTRLYPLQHYTQSGDLKPPLIFHLILIFLARTWILFIISLVSRNNQGQLLTLFYPQTNHFYLGLISGLIAIVLFFLAGRDHDKYTYIRKLWQRGYQLLLLSVFIDFALQLYYLFDEQFKYSLTASVQLVFVIWILLYCFRSKHLRDCFKRNH